MTQEPKGNWHMPETPEQALKVLREVGFDDRPGLKVWRIEEDRILVTDEKHGAYTVFVVFNAQESSVRFQEDAGWPA